MDASVATVLQEAIRLHRQGALPEAVRGYTQVLGADPSNADAHYYLAVVSYQQDKIGEAIDLAGKALAIRPDDARLHRLAGQAQLRLGRNVSRWRVSIGRLPLRRRWPKPMAPGPTSFRKWVAWRRRLQATTGL